MKGQGDTTNIKIHPVCHLCQPHINGTWAVVDRDPIHQRDLALMILSALLLICYCIAFVMKVFISRAVVMFYTSLSLL